MILKNYTYYVFVVYQYERGPMIADRLMNFLTSLFEYFGAQVMKIFRMCLRSCDLNWVINMVILTRGSYLSSKRGNFEGS